MIKKPTSNHENPSRRGSVDDAAEPRFLVIGQVGKPHGIRGEVRVTLHTDLPERFTWLETIYVGESDPQSVLVEKVRFHKGMVLLKLAGYDDRNAAELLRGQWLQIPEEEGIPLEEGEYYLFQIEGLEVYTDQDEHLGQLVQVLQTKANNVFLVQGPAGEILLPDIEEVVLDIDFDNNLMRVHLLPGLLPR